MANVTPNEVRRLGGPVLARVSLRIAGESVEPDDVTRILGRAPTYSHRVGDLVSRRGNTTRKHGMWSLDAALPSSTDISRQILWIFAQLPGGTEPWAELALRNAEVDVCCFVEVKDENGGFVLSAEALEALSTRRLEVSFDIYTSETSAPSTSAE